ncbi:hypothetical protein, partial [Escherichia coli]|uniref:hypothetical protein n=1 Tax=Escherichia coli TaxID=562 RepID=UPI001835B917
LLTLAGMHVGVPVAPISPAYSLVSKDFAKLREIAALLRPGAIHAAESAHVDKAIAALELDVPRIVVPADIVERSSAES